MNIAFREQKVWPMYSLNIALRKYMADEMINIVLRYCYSVFDKYLVPKTGGHVLKV
jgi:hypothetical protein